MIKWLTKAVGAMRHPGHAGGLLGWLLKRTRYDYRKEVGDGLDSSVVTAPIRWVQRAMPEARLAVQRRKKDGSVEQIADHPMLALIQRPNPYYGDIALLAGTILSWFLDGNAYWIIIRNGVGRPAELWYAPHWTMEPKWPEDGSVYLSHYRYSPGGGAAPIDLPVEDVVHFRDGINPRNTRKGLGALDGVIREIFVDLESSNFVASLLRNMGAPGVVISPKSATVSADDVAATKTFFEQGFGGDNRGRTLVMGAPTDVQPYGFNPQQMNMSEGRDVAEERVCACIGVPAAVVGFGAGLQTAKVGATMQELHKIAWQNGVLPLGRALCDEIKRSLLPLFGNDAGLEVYFNTDDVPALQEDEDKQAERWGKMLGGGGITLFDYKTALGLEASDADRIYLRPINLMEVPEGSTPAALLPAPKAAGQKARASAAAMVRAERYALMMQAREKGLSDAFEARLKTWFRRLGTAAVDAAAPLIADQWGKAQKSDDLLIAMILDKLGLPAWAAELSQAYGAHYLEVAKASGEAAERAGLGASLPDPVARAIMASGGRRAGMIDLEGQTRGALFDALTEGRAEGDGAEQLAGRILPYVEGGPWRSAETRARIIARTETKYAQNISTIERGRAAGVGSFVIFDGRLGPGRSVPSHIARNGLIASTDEAIAMAEAEHPNGTLSFAPHFAEED